MSMVTLYGFPRSTFVKVCGLILTARNVDYRFHDTEDEMYLPVHLERHPFGRVPALQHDDFVLYETNAIAAYIDDVFPGPKLTPADPGRRHRHDGGLLPAADAVRLCTDAGRQAAPAAIPLGRRLGQPDGCIA